MGSGLNGSLYPEDRNCSAGCTGKLNHWRPGTSCFGATCVSTSKSLLGPWRTQPIATCAQLPRCQESSPLGKLGKPTGNAPDPAPVVNQDGSVSMIWRSVNWTYPGASFVQLATAPAWSGPYNWTTRNMFADWTHAIHIEDSYLWKGPRGWHALFHSNVSNAFIPRMNVTSAAPAAGGHGYAEHFEGPWFFSHENAYGSTVELTNGTTVRLRQRERPKLLLTPEGQPHYLANGAGWIGDCDRTFTIIQPIAQ
jgi:hypothetical protein